MCVLPASTRGTARSYFLPTVREAWNVNLKPRVNELAAGSTDAFEARLAHLDVPMCHLRHRSLFGIGT